MNEREWSAAGAVAFLLAGGVALAIFGGLVIGINWPGQELVTAAGTDMWGNATEAEYEETGSEGWVLIGIIGAAIGQLMLTVSVIAYGVRLGTRS